MISTLIASTIGWVLVLGLLALTRVRAVAKAHSAGVIFDRRGGQVFRSTEPAYFAEVLRGEFAGAFLQCLVAFGVPIVAWAQILLQAD